MRSRCLGDRTPTLVPCRGPLWPWLRRDALAVEAGATSLLGTSETKAELVADQADHHRGPPAPRRRHRVARGADRAPHRAHQPPHRAPQDPQEGPPQPPWPAHAGRSAPPDARLRRGTRRRALPGASSPSSACAGSRPLARAALRGRSFAQPRHRAAHGRLSVADPRLADRATPPGSCRLGTGPPLRTAAAWRRRGKEHPHMADRHPIVSRCPSRAPTRPSPSRPASSPCSRRAPSSPRIGDTIVLATANAANGVREGIDFFPLTVDVEERAYAAGKIPGSFFRREGRPTEDAILTCRLTDRPLRPSFPDGFRNETQVVITVLGADQENPHDVLAINAASAALMLCGIPFEGPIGAVRIAYSQDGEWIPHPTYDEGDDEHVRARRRRSRARQRRRRHHDGRGRRHREGLRLLRGRRAEGRRGRPRRRARGLQDVDQGVDRPPARARRPRPACHRAAWPFTPVARLRRRRVRGRASRAGHRRAGQGHHHRGQGRAQRGHRRRRGRRSSPSWPAPATSPAPSPAARRRSRRPSARSPRSWCASASSRRACASTAVAHATCARCRPRSACCPRPTARACSSGARPRCSTSARWPCRA